MRKAAIEVAAAQVEFKDLNGEGKMHTEMDTHLSVEFADNKAFLKANQLTCKGDVLLLAGDIVPFALMEKHKDFSPTFPITSRLLKWIPG